MVAARGNSIWATADAGCKALLSDGALQVLSRPRMQPWNVSWPHSSSSSSSRRRQRQWAGADSVSLRLRHRLKHARQPGPAQNFWKKERLVLGGRGIGQCWELGPGVQVAATMGAMWRHPPVMDICIT